MRPTHIVQTVLDHNQHAASKKPPVVLVVEDDDDVRYAVEGLLGIEGYDVDSAPNGLVALRKLREDRLADVILLDVMMPTMDGWDFRAEQLRDPALRLIPTLVTSAAGFSAETIWAQFAGLDYLPKPFAEDVLLAKIARLSGRSITIAN
jgi:CheY-like chemotaxis protein